MDSRLSLSSGRMLSSTSLLVASNSRKYFTLCSRCLLWLTPVSRSKPEIRFFVWPSALLADADNATYGGDPGSLSKPCGTREGSHNASSPQSCRHRSDRSSSSPPRSHAASQDAPPSPVRHAGADD